MSAELVKTSVTLQHRLQSIPPVPWRDPQSVSPEALAGYIQTLEAACLENPRSADLRTCLGMAYAVNYDVYKSMDALELAVSIDPTHFWAQLKYGELQYRLRALLVAEKETAKALALAENSWQFSLARKQLQEIRSTEPRQHAECRVGQATDEAGADARRDDGADISWGWSWRW